MWASQTRIGHDLHPHTKPAKFGHDAWDVHKKYGFSVHVVTDMHRKSRFLRHEAAGEPGISKEGGMVRPGYKQTEVGDIPEDWGVQPVGEAYEIKNNLRLPINKKIRESMEGTYPYYGPTSVQGYINEYRVEGEHALIGEDGDHFLKWRDTSMTLLVDGKFNVNNHAHIVKGFKNLTTWFYYFFSNRDLTAHLTRQGAGRYKLNKSSLEKILCVVPPNSEQQVIAEALADVDGLLAGQTKLIAKKRAIKAGTMQQLLTGKTRLPRFGEGQGYKQTKVGEIPEDWDVVSLANISRNNGLVRGPFGGNLKKEFFVKNGYKVYEQRNAIYKTLEIGNYFIDSNKFKELSRFAVCPGNLIVSCSGTIGCIYEIPESAPEGVINQALLKIELNDALIDSGFFLSIFRWDKFQEKITENSHGGAMQNLVGMDTFRNTLIQLPNLQEQQAIATVLSDMDTEIETLEGRLAKSRAIKQGMMQELLTGRTRLI